LSTPREYFTGNPRLIHVKQKQLPKKQHRKVFGSLMWTDYFGFPYLDEI